MNNRTIETIERVWGPTSATPASTPVTIAATSTAILAARTDGRRKHVILQNNGTEPVIIRLGGDASTAVYNVVLKDGSAGRDGNGASITIDNYQGSIYGIVEANTGVISILEMLSE